MFTVPVLSQIVLNGFVLAAIYTLVALGFTLIFGIMRIINFAHGEFAMLGGFLVFFMLQVANMPFFVALPLASFAVACGGLVLEALVYRPFYQKELQGMIATIGLSTVIVYSAVLLFGSHQRSIPASFTAIFTIGPVILPADRLAVLTVAAIALAAFYVFITFTRIGLAMRVVAQDLEIAEAQGINARATYRAAFFVATFLAALAGGLLAQLYSLSPFMGRLPLVKSFIVVILGGLGSIPGAAAGGLVLGMFESFVSTFYGLSVAQFASLGAVIVLLVLRPEGLLGRAER
jgi:branched-chain amino acid transport system permease protein